MVTIMIVMGICVVIYTVLGGLEAVIWTEVFQAVLLTLGALLILYLLLTNVDGGAQGILAIGMQDNKFSLGSFNPDFIGPSFWVILLYGFFINLNNFGMDQNYVQRYHAASSAKEAAKSVWLCVKLYLPISFLFFIIGTGLYAYYQQNPELTSLIRLQAAAELLPLGASGEEVSALASTLKPNEYGDITGISMIGVQSILDLWWELSGIFAGGMLGLFFLGLISKKAGNSEAIAATIIGVMVIIWMTFSYLIPDHYSFLKYPLHTNMIIVVGTLTIFLSGSLITKLKTIWRKG